MDDDDLLWHYTDGAALLGIAETRVLRATQIQYLNDFEELTHLVDRMVEFAGTYGGDGQAEHYQLAIDLRRTLEHPRSFPICVSSLTELRDDLSQWRGYSRHGDGYAIAFRAGDLRAWVARQPAASNGIQWKLTPLLYGGELIDAVSESLFKIAAKVRAEEGGTSRAISRGQKVDWLSDNPFVPAPLALLLEKTMDVGPTFKNPSFAAEREWRIVTPPMTDGAFKLRPTATMLVPYTELELGDEVPIREVIVGPGPHSALNAASIKRLSGLADAEIGISAIPFRDW